MNFEYRLGAPKGTVLHAYMADRSRVSLIRGALGSGKTIGTIQKIMALMCEQEPNHQTLRQTRWVAIRNTYSDLFNTTIKDWLGIMGDLGRFTHGGMKPPSQYLYFKLPDRTIVQAEMIFLALDRPDAIKKLRGTQVTGFWHNEIKELHKDIIDMADLRHGRYPANPTWHGMLGDTNAPDDDHWYAELEKNPPPDWKFFVQAGGVIKHVDNKGNVSFVPNPDAENLSNLPDDYYIKGMAGKSVDWIDVNLANNFGSVMDGKPVHPWFSDSCTSNESYIYDPNLPLIVGVDFGRTPAAAFMQLRATGRWHVFDELVTEDMSAQTFAPLLKSKIDSLHPVACRVWCDPAGTGKGQATDDTPIRILQAAGIPARPTLYPTARQNNIEIRRASISVPCTTNCMDGSPMLLVHSDAKVLIKGLKGGFCYRRLQVAGEQRYEDVPSKNKYSHIVEALEYGLSGEGVGNLALGYNSTPSRSKQAKLGGRR